MKKKLSEREAWLYPESEWTWHRLKGRTQTNDEAPEVLLVREGEV